MQGLDRICRDIAEFHPNILATGVAKDAEFLAYYFKERVWIPKPERLTVMLGQAMVLVGLPKINEDFFGKTNVVTVQHEKMHILLFPDHRESALGEERESTNPALLDTDPCIVVVVAMPPFQHEELVSRVLGYLESVNICTI